MPTMLGAQCYGFRSRPGHESGDVCKGFSMAGTKHTTEDTWTEAQYAQVVIRRFEAKQQDLQEEMNKAQWYIDRWTEVAQGTRQRETIECYETAMARQEGHT